jgi:hypothetical protein
MEKVISLVSEKSTLKIFLVDLLILSFIYFLPAISHLFAFPIYYLDPMRIALVFALIFTSKRNAFLIALSIPLFSFLISSHPSVLKSILLAVELTINLGLFYLIKDKINNLFISFFVSVIISKVVYYLLKFFFINFGMLNDKLISTPIVFQIASAIILSFTIYLLGKKNNLIN